VIAHTGADPSDFGGAARFYWTLKLAGIKRLSILDGGLGAWGALGYPLEKTTPVIKPTKIRVTLDKTQIVTTPRMVELVKQRDAGKRKLLLSDSRPEDYFSGADKHPASPRAGTLPGAKHFEHEEWFQMNTGKLQPKAKLEAIAKSAGLITDEEVVTFCNTGHWSSTTWFVISEILGRPNIKLYPESTVGWSKTRNRMDNEPARQKVLINQLKEAVDNLKN
jgi:thiosulfate/3-mercaptopyruvate sulfurtransferase